MTMSDREWLAERFEEHRRQLRAVAYRMLGSLNEADDAVQEAWIRLSRQDAAAIENLGGWLTTCTTFSPSLSTTSPPSSPARLPRHGSSQAAPAAASKGLHRCPTPI